MTEPRPNNFGTIAQQALLGLGTLGASIGTIAFGDQTLNRALDHARTLEITPFALAAAGSAAAAGWLLHRFATHELDRGR